MQDGSMDEQHEQETRTRAIRWWLRHIKRSEICARLKRSRSWLKKWIRRYRVHGWAGLVSESHAPHTHPDAYNQQARDEIARARKRLQRRPVGLIGGKYIRRELERGEKMQRLPSRATVYRVLNERALTGTHGHENARPVYFPQPHGTARYVIRQTDWTEKVLEGGAKVYAFHSVDLSDHAMWQTIAGDKNGATVKQHLLETCKNMGIPDGWQLDNDAAFCGGYKVQRVFGATVRLCLYLGSEPIFIPVAEPYRNGEVERLNGLWAQAFWDRQHFDCLADVQRAQPKFTRWYAQDYLSADLIPSIDLAPSLHHLHRRCLTERDIAHLPSELPITAGRVHFIRQVQPDGTIGLLNEKWHVTRRLAGQYVWATVVTHEHRLVIYHKRAADQPAYKVKEFEYALHEPVRPLAKHFRRTSYRRKMDTML